MKLTWMGHACFKLEKDGHSLLIDPYADHTVPGLSPIREQAEIVLCSHGHSDHHGTECVEIKAAPTPSPFVVEELDTFHDEVRGAKRGPNKIFVISDGCSKIAHLGDLGCELEPEQKERLTNLDVLLVPVGGYYTIDGNQAAALVQELKPKIVIPMHYRDEEKGFGYDVISTVSVFLERMDSIITLQTSTIDCTEDHSAQVLVLSPQKAFFN